MTKTLRDYHSAYLQWRQSLRLSKQTIEKDQYHLQRFILFLESLNVTAPEQIRKSHLHRWQEHIATLCSKTSGEPLRPRSINTNNETVRCFLRYLSDRNHMQGSLVEEVRYVKKPQTLPMNVLAHEQVRKLLSRIPTSDSWGYRDKAMLELLYTSGIRAAELLGIDLPHLNLKDKVVIVTGKGSKQRVVPIGRTALRHLQTYIVAVRPFLVKSRSETALFIGHNGKRLHYRQLLKCIHAYTEAAKLDANVTPHTFRRSCTTELIRGGANLYHVKELLGHECLDTLKHYTKLTINDLQKTHEKCHPREREDR